MRLLAIETATTSVGVALVEEEEVLASFSARPGRRHAETLHPAIEFVLGSVSVKLAAIDAVAVDVGPGLFTGLRVGLAAAKALAFSLGIPVVRATSTEVLRRMAKDTPRPAVGVVDLRRGEVAYQLGDDPEIRVGSPEDLIAELNKDAALGRALLLGDGARRHREVIAEGAPEALVAPERFAAPDVVELGLLGIERLHRGEVCDAFALVPQYLRGADVRLGWVTRDDVDEGAAR